MASAYPPTGSQPPSVELIVRQGPRPGQRFSLTQPTIVIGREAGNDVAINDPQISRRHASLTWDGRQFIIQDLGSVNGTFVNGVRLTAPRVLQQGDVIGLGSTVLLGFQALPVAPAPPRPAAPPPAYAPRPPARRRGRFLIPLAALLGLCGLLVVAAALGYFFLWPRPETRPLVLINSPRHGEQVEVGQEVTVQSIARDEGKVVRVELWVDGQLQESQTSTLPGGTSPFPMLARWHPPSPGTHTLIARAFNAQGGRANASINVEAIRVDRDGDGVADDADLCPDEPGPEAASGCPDRDGDSIPDNIDDCPDEPGSPVTEGCPDADGDAIPDGIDACPEEPGAPGAPEGDGCPAPTDENRDGDGIPDDEDDCPDEPGSPWTAGCPDADGDGVRDSEDDCPDEPGPAERDGCPGPVGVVDTDGDGTPDDEDDCPDMWGPAEHDGCPDSDGDGVPDDEDACPETPGLPGGAGCPDTGAGDRDGDGVPDDVDLSDEEPGLPEHGGAPPPGGEEMEEGPLGPVDFGDVVPGLGDDVIIMNPVEFEALEFEVYHDYQELHCYAGLAGEYMERYDFEPLGERQWDITEHLGGENSRLVIVPEGEPLEVQVECWASNIYIEPPPEEPPEGVVFGAGGWGPVWELGSFERSHPPLEWNGDDIIVPSDPGPDEHSFQVKYRLCADACETAALPAPYIHTLYYWMGEPRIAWIWDGDESMISGFKVYVDGSFWRGPRRDLRAFTLHGLEPSCGERLELRMTAYSGATLVPDRESPRSNTVVLEGPPCPLPDLTPTDVTVHDGQLRIHILNEGGPLRSEDITVRFETLVSRALINTATWPAVNISPEGIRFLQTSEAVEPLPLRVIVDPDNDIEEMNEDNNTYGMPVVMRVEFLRVHAPFCNEWSCSIVSCDSEHAFYLWAGHGRTLSDANWVAHRYFPPDGGYLRATCGHQCGSGSPSEAWRMEGDERYTFEFEVPPSENLYVKVTGQEIDHGPTDWDSLGQVESGYTPAQNWGARPEPYEDDYGRETSCDDPFCSECPTGLWARWRITRVR